MNEKVIAPAAASASATPSAVPVGTTVWIISWNGTVLSGSASTAMTSAKHNVTSSTRTSQVTFQIYTPAVDAASAQTNAASYAASAGFILIGSPISVVDSGEAVS